MTAHIYRYEVPVDDQGHTLTLRGDPLAVGCRTINVVEFWARHVEGGVSDDERRRFRVVGTGHPFPDNARYWGTAVAPGGQLVWHLMEEL